MRSVLVVSLAVVLVAPLVGCGGANTHEAVMNSSISLMEEFVGVMKKLKTPEDVQKHAGTLKSIAQRMEQLKAKADAMPSPSADVEAQLQAKFEPRIQKLTGEMMGAMTTLSPEVQAELGKIEGLEGVMMGRM